MRRQSDAGMTLEVGLDALRLAARLNPSSCGIVFFGGEPLLHKNLMRVLVAEARKLEAIGAKADSTSS